MMAKTLVCYFAALGMAVSIVGTTAYGRIDGPRRDEGLAGDYDASGDVGQGDLDLVLLHWGKRVSADALPAGWVGERPADGIIGQNALDAVILGWGKTAGGGAIVQTEESSGPNAILTTVAITVFLAAALWHRYFRGRAASAVD